MLADYSIGGEKLAECFGTRYIKQFLDRELDVVETLMQYDEHQLFRAESVCI